MNLLGMRMPLTSLSNHELALFSLLVLLSLYLVSDPHALAIGFVIVPPCQNRKNLFFFSCSVQSALLFWSGISFPVWLLLKRKISMRKSWKESTPALTAFFNHHCLPLQCVCPFPKPALWLWCTIMAKYSISFQQALHIVLLLMMLFIYQNRRQYDITFIQWAQQETF